jgi:hypothetical protein
MNQTLILLFAASLFAACGDKTPPAGTHTHADGTVHANEPGGHVHTERTPLGEIKVGEHTVGVFQLAKIEAGKQADFDLDFPAGKLLPSTVRGWIGVESGQGSMKVKFDKETPTRMHGHPLAPSPIPAASAFWVEIEEGGVTKKASVAWK